MLAFAVTDWLARRESIEQGPVEAVSAPEPDDMAAAIALLDADADAEELERYSEAEEEDRRESDTWPVKDINGQIVGWGKNRRWARMIAAALNLTKQVT